MHPCRQQCLVAEWLGLGYCQGMGFLPSFLSNTFVLHVNGSCDVHGVRTKTVCDVTMMYCKERYMENVPKVAGDYGKDSTCKALSNSHYHSI